MDIEITKALCLSTAHVSEETRRWLDREHSDYGAPFTVWESEHGYFLSVDWVKPGFVAPQPEKVIPDDLRACAEMAAANDCKFLRLDSDGPVSDALPTFDDE